MRAYPTMTPSQKAGLVAWWLAHGDGLTEARIRQLGGTEEPWQILDCIKKVADVRKDDDEIWSWQGGRLSPAYTVARNRPKDRRKDKLARERAALVAFKLATRGEVRTADLMVQLGLTRQAVVFLLGRLSNVLPICLDPHDGRWFTMDFRESED